MKTKKGSPFGLPFKCFGGERGSNTIHLYRSRQEIADSFGIQKFSLLRVLSDFQKEGAIKINGKEITILDRSKMKSIS